jgi:hypothetical protein
LQSIAAFLPLPAALSPGQLPQFAIATTTELTSTATTTIINLRIRTSLFGFGNNSDNTTLALPSTFCYVIPINL